MRCTQRLVWVFAVTVIAFLLVMCDRSREHSSVSNSAANSEEKRSSIEPNPIDQFIELLAQELARNTIAFWNSQHAIGIVVVYKDQDAKAMALPGSGDRGEPLSQAVEKLSLANKGFDDVRARLRELLANPELRGIANLIVWGTLRNEVIFDSFPLPPRTETRKTQTIGGKVIELPYVVGNKTAVSVVCIRAVEILTDTTAKQGEAWAWAPPAWVHREH